MVNCTSAFRTAHIPRWEAPQEDQPNLNNSNKPEQGENSPTKPTPLPLRNCISARPAESVPTSTITDVPTRPISDDWSIYGRLKARAVIWAEGYVPGGAKRDSLPNDAKVSGRRRRLRTRIELKLYILHSKLERRLEKVEHIAFRRTDLRVKRGVNKVRPLKIFLKSFARSETSFDVRWQKARNGSTASLTRSIIQEPGQVVEGRREISVKEFARQDGETADDFSLPAGASNSETTAPRQSDVDISDEAVQDLINQFQRHNEAYKAETTEPYSLAGKPSRLSTSISAQIAGSYFSTLVPMDIVRRFPSTHRAIIKASNKVIAQNDLVQISHIWSKVIGCAPSRMWLEPYRPLQELHDADAEKLCKLLEEGLHRYAYWTLVARMSAIEREGATDDAWWLDLERELEDLGQPDIETLCEQLVVVGAKFIDPDALSEIITAMTSESYLLRYADTVQIAELGVSTEGEALLAMDTTEQTLNPNFEAPSILEPQAQSSRPTRRLPTGSCLVTDEQTHAPPYSLEQVSLSTDAPEGNVVSQSVVACDEESVFQAARKSSLPTEEACCKESMSSSSDILGEVMAELDAEIGSAAFVPKPDRRIRPSQLPRSLTIRKSQPALPKQESTEAKPSQPKRQDSPQNELAAAALTRENGWISALDLTDFKPEDVVYEVYKGPPHLSNKVRGKLPVPRSLSSTVGYSRPVSKAMESKIPASGTPRSRLAVKVKTPSGKGPDKGPIPSVQMPQVAPQARSKSQGDPKIGLRGRNVARSTTAPAHRNNNRAVSSQVARKPSGAFVKTERLSTASRAPPLPTSKQAASQNAAAKSLSSRSAAENRKSKVPRASPELRLSIAATKAQVTRSIAAATVSSLPKPRIPVPAKRRQDYMPGSFPTDGVDTETED